MHCLFFVVAGCVLCIVRWLLLRIVCCLRVSCWLWLSVVVVLVVVVSCLRVRAFLVCVCCVGVCFVFAV